MFDAICFDARIVRLDARFDLSDLVSTVPIACNIQVIHCISEARAHDRVTWHGTISRLTA